MREILFRGKHKQDNRWLQGDFHLGFMSGGAYINGYEVEPSTVGQYTGLTDKTGKRIFEGDIIKTPYYILGRAVGDEITQVLFENGEFGIKYQYKFIPLADLRIPTKYEYVSNIGDVATEWDVSFEIIGNIYENV